MPDVLFFTSIFHIPNCVGDRNDLTPYELRTGDCTEVDLNSSLKSILIPDKTHHV